MAFDWKRLVIGLLTIGLSEMAQSKSRKTRKVAEVGGKVLDAVGEADTEESDAQN